MIFCFPFEIIGAEWIDSQRLKCDLDSLHLDGCAWRVHHFEPTFHKFGGKLCGGVQLHVTDKATFRPVVAGFAVIWAMRLQAPHISTEPVSFDPAKPATAPLSKQMYNTLLQHLAEVWPKELRGAKVGAVSEESECFP